MHCESKRRDLATKPLTRLEDSGLKVCCLSAISSVTRPHVFASDTYQMIDVYFGKIGVNSKQLACTAA